MSAKNEKGIDRIAAMRFVEALSDAPAEVWLEAARAAEVASAERARALDVIAALVNEHRLGLERWYLDDAIETAAWYALSRCFRVPARGHWRSRNSAIEVARIASAALLLRRYLTPVQFDVLYGPFQAIQAVLP